MRRRHRSCARIGERIARNRHLTAAHAWPRQQDVRRPRQTDLPLTMSDDGRAAPGGAKQPESARERARWRANSLLSESDEVPSAQLLEDVGRNGSGVDSRGAPVLMASGPREMPLGQAVSERKGQSGSIHYRLASMRRHPRMRHDRALRRSILHESSPAAKSALATAARPPFTLPAFRGSKPR